MAMKEGTRRGLQLFSRRTAPFVKDTGAQRPPEMDDAGREAVPELYAGAGTVTKLLYGDPDGPDDGGMSLTWARFGANFPLPRHSHNVDCVYYIIAGSVQMGNQTLGAGDGFFAGADAPYGYTAGPDGVELVEFRPKTCYDSRLRESPEGWTRIIDGVRANRDAWVDELAPYRQ